MVILIWVGLGFDLVVLRKFLVIVSRLVFLFCFLECLICVVVLYFLMDFFWVWVFFLG